MNVRQTSVKTWLGCFCQNCFPWPLVIESQPHLHNLFTMICVKLMIEETRLGNFSGKQFWAFFYFYFRLTVVILGLLWWRPAALYLASSKTTCFARPVCRDWLAYMIWPRSYKHTTFSFLHTVCLYSAGELRLDVVVGFQTPCHFTFAPVSIMDQH